MTLDDLVTHFGSQVEAAKALKLTKGAVNQWRKTGIPYLRQLQIQKVTRGRLKADEQAA